MGIPKFYRWLSERYPLCNQPGGATVIPIIDNFYLDMNGIIHNCTHGNDQEQSKLTEDEMILRIFAYLDKLFHIVKPQKVMFMAIDGVAPRAKMNQQRARRFKAAREAEEAAQAAARRGEDLNGEVPRFDSNCITPGTPFMARLGAHLRFFIRKKIAEDTAWQKPTIIFSGHDVPGEGEHKVMEYIRWARRDTAVYQPNTRHCLYGLDADLIMLSLVTHEPHFCLLREVVSYGSGGRGQPSREVLENPCQEHFVLLQIGLLREYFDIEFKPIAKSLPFEYNLERIIDDFVLFCMLVGNDFLPPLPTVDIAEGSLDTMFSLYRTLLPRMGGYLTHAGNLHRGRLEIFMKALAEMEADVLEARALDAEDQDSRTRSRNDKMLTKKSVSNSTSNLRLSSSVTTNEEGNGQRQGDITQVGHELELLAVVEGEGEGEGEGEELEARPTGRQEGPTMMSEEARALFLSNDLGDKAAALAAWKRRYYADKLGLPHPESQGRAVLESYIQGLHWVLEYYYRGVASWNWFYPYHYAPMASDFTNLAAIEVTFSLGTPFSPYEQLLSVQPSASSTLLPQPYRWLMTDPTSPIADFYPTDFNVDLEGKRAAWEGVVLIPFIDEARLRAAARSVPQGTLTPEERERNAAGGVLVFNHKEGSNDVEFCTSTLPAHYTSIMRSNSTATVHPPPPPLPVGEKGFVPRVVDGTQVGPKSPAGFPTLKTLTVTGELRKAGINVFGSASRKESLILKVAPPPPSVTAAQVGEAIIGRRAWVKWPYLQEAQVVAVTDSQGRATKQHSEKTVVEKSHTAMQAEEWTRTATTLASEHLLKHGIDIGDIKLLLHVRPCEGLIREIDGTVEKRFAKVEVAYPLHVTLHKNPAPDPRFETAAGFLNSWSTFGQNLEVGQQVIFLGRAHYGCSAEISKVARSKDASSGGSKPYTILLSPAPPNAAQSSHTARRILSNVTVNYQPSGQIARKLGVSPRTLGRMTGNIWIKIGEERRDRVDIGLCVKNGAKGLFVPDYCVPVANTGNNDGRKSEGGGEIAKPKGGWLYSEAMVRVLQQYKQRFPWAWAALQAAEGEGASLEGDTRGVIPLEQLLPGLSHEAAMAQLSQLKSWVASQPLARRPLVKATSQVAPEEAIRMLQSALQHNSGALSKIERIELENVAPALLLPPLDRGGPASAFVGGTFEIGDRVVAVGSTGTPPFGHRGTVTAVYDDVVEVLFDGDEFLGGTDLFGRCQGKCGALVLPSELLNLSKPHAVSQNVYQKRSGHLEHAQKVESKAKPVAPKLVAPKLVAPKVVAPSASLGPPPLPPLPSPSLLKSGEEGGGKEDVAKAFWTLLTNAQKK